MFGYFARNGFALIVATLFLTAAAHADDWRIVQSSGQIWIGSGDVQKASFEPDATLPGGATLTTGKSGRVMLVHGAQTLMIGPNAVVTIPAGDSNGITTILQRAGEITFDVDRQKVRHFAVETPYLAAVVKGTHFTVRIGGKRAVVMVARGLVGVTDLATGETADVPPGQSATVGGPNSHLTISGVGKLAAITKGKIRRALVDPLSPTESASLETATAGNGLALGLTAVPANPNGVGLGVGLGGGNAGGNEDGNGGGNAGGNGDGNGNGGGDGKD